MQATGKKPRPRPTEAKSVKQDDPEQSKRFLEAAREHGATTTEEEARKAFRKVVGKLKPRKRG